MHNCRTRVRVRVHAKSVFLEDIVKEKLVDNQWQFYIVEVEVHCCVVSLIGGIIGAEPTSLPPYVIFPSHPFLATFPHKYSRVLPMFCIQLMKIHGSKRLVPLDVFLL